MEKLTVDGGSVWNDETRGGIGTWPVGQSFQTHSHEGAGEYFLFLEGECEFTAGDETVVFGPGEGVYVEPGEPHSMTAVGHRPLVVFMCVFPNHEPTHTFYRADGSPVHWNRPGPGIPSARPMGPTPDELEAMP